MTLATYLPRTKLWGDPEHGYVIVLECDCGTAVDYPGHPDDETTVTCPECHRLWAIEATSD